MVLPDQGDLEEALKHYQYALSIKEREAPDSFILASTYKATT